MGADTAGVPEDESDPGHSPAIHADPGQTALFLDFDGTLVELAETPDGIAVPAELPGILRALEARFGGALAIVTGRGLPDLRRYLPDAPAYVIAGHGAQTEGPEGTRTHPLVGSGTLRRLQAVVSELAATEPGLLAEAKPTGAVLHYRRAPGAEARVRAAMASIARSCDAVELHRAKMAFELRPAGIGKDHAVADLMRRAPFAGRRPIVFGDDLTDEAAFAWANGQGGVSVKVGTGDSVAGARLGGPSAVLDLLNGWVRS